MNRNGPQIEHIFPPFPTSTGSNEIPAEWSFITFTCLPDGAHVSEQEFIFFNLPPIHSLPAPYNRTVFGLACFRQIETQKLVHKTQDMTRETVQKSIVLLSSDPVLGLVRSKLGFVTQAFFEQRDFSQIDILQTLHSNLTQSLGFPKDRIWPNGTLYQGISVRHFLDGFQQKTLQIYKSLLLKKKILFCGQKVDKITSFQYALVSLFPDLQRNINPGQPSNTQSRSSAFHMPLDIFNQVSMKHVHINQKKSIWLPYVPLQQLDVLLASTTESFLAGTSNTIVTQKCKADLIVNCDDFSVQFMDPQLSQTASLTFADKKFMDDILEHLSVDHDDPMLNHSISFNGSDDDIRNKFEKYLYSLLVATVMTAESTIQITINDTLRFFNRAQILSDYNTGFVQHFEYSQCYHEWYHRTRSSPIPNFNSDFVTKGHPCIGTTIMSSVLGNLGKSISPLQQNFAKVSSTMVEQIKNPKNQQKISDTASQVLFSVSSWYSLKKKQIGEFIDSSQTSTQSFTSQNHQESNQQEDEDSVVFEAPNDDQDFTIIQRKE